jgi:hypothetical protein
MVNIFLSWDIKYPAFNIINQIDYIYGIIDQNL